jgi:hypothetical protein
MVSRKETLKHIQMPEQMLRYSVKQSQTLNSGTLL